MKRLIIASLLVVGGFGALIPHVSAYTLDPLYDETPLSFMVSGRESFSGVTAGGYTFSQERIVTDDSVRIHKFVIADRHFYMSDRGYIEAVDDLSAISIYLSLG